MEKTNLLQFTNKFIECQKYLALLFLFIISVHFVRSQSFEWVSSISGKGNVDGYNVTVDQQNNVITAGRFNGDSCDFNSGSGTFLLHSNGNYDAYIQKVDSGGNLLWAKQFGGSGYAEINSVHTDSGGNIYAAGQFGGLIDFDPDTGVVNFMSSTFNTFVLKLDQNGVLLWAKHIGDSDPVHCHAMAIDPNGNVFLTGRFGNSPDFDPGPAISRLTSNGSNEIFIQKLDSVGNFSWAISIGGSGNDVGGSIEIDPNNNVLITGIYNGSVDFDPSASNHQLTSNGGREVFILKLNHSGNFIWAKSVGGNYADNSYDIATNLNGEVYITGSFYDTVDFDPGVNQAIFSAHGLDFYVLKLDQQGLYKWARTISPDSNNYRVLGKSITTTPNGDVWITGEFFDSVDFNPGVGTFYLSPAMLSPSTFLLNLSDTGSFKWAGQFIGVPPFGGSAPYSICYQNGSIYTTGDYFGTVDFDPFTNNQTNLSASGAFVHKMNVNSLSTGLKNQINFLPIKLYPNPNKGHFSISLDKSYKNIRVRVFNSAGKQVKQINYNSLNQLELNLDLPRGIYFIELSTPSSVIGATKFIIQY